MYNTGAKLFQSLLWSIVLNILILNYLWDLSLHARKPVNPELSYANAVTRIRRRSMIISMRCFISILGQIK